MGAITAGAVITPVVACSSDTHVASAPPNAYRFFKVLDGSASVSFTRRDRRITGADGKPLVHIDVEPMLSDGGRLVFVGLDESDRQGVYDVTLTFGPDPIASVPKLLVQVGQTLSAALGGGTVTEVATLDLAQRRAPRRPRSHRWRQRTLVDARAECSLALSRRALREPEPSRPPRPRTRHR